MLFEERPNDEAAHEAFFGEGDDIKGTLDLLEKEIYDDHDNWIDQSFVLRSRLFDMVIGDWDRHDDQWRWVGKKIEGKKGRRYRPIPRDRDQAFFITQGLIPRIAASKWAVPSSEGFDEHINWAPGFNWNMRYFDRTFLTDLTWEEWEEEIKNLQSRLTDASIEQSILDFPDTVYTLTGEQIVRTIKARRDDMPRYARELYEYLSREVEVVGTNQREHFVVERLNDNQTKVTVHKKNKEDELKGILYERIFLHKETREVRLYGLGGKDSFVLQGEVKKGLKVRIIGGKKKDEIKDESIVHRGGKKTIVYDKPKTNVTASKETKLKLSEDDGVNLYNRKAYVYNRLIPLVSAQFNPDNGFFLGGGFFLTTHKWRKAPFASQQTLLVHGAVQVDSYNLKYSAKFTDVIGKWGLETTLEVQEPFFISNFFGFGNTSSFDFDGETVATGDDPIDFYRLQTDRSLLQINTTRQLGEYLTFRGGTITREARVRNSADETKFITSGQSDVLFSDVSRRHFYTGFNTGFTFDKRNHNALPSEGTLINANFEQLWGLNDRSAEISRLSADLSFYIPFRFPARVVLANRVGVEHFIQENFDFFNNAQLGGLTNLRGFRRNRFQGQTAFYHNLDVRLKLFSFNTYLFPGQFGLLAYQDVGRVWLPGEDSDVWQVSRGVGAYVAPLNLTAITFNYNFTKEENLFTVRFGFFF